MTGQGDSVQCSMLTVKIAELVAAKRSANELLQDLKSAIAEARQLRDEIKAAAEKDVNEFVKPIVVEGMAQFGEELKTNIDAATQAVFDRFDTITAELLGETQRNLKKGNPTIPELAEAIGVINRAEQAKKEKH